MTQTQYVLFEKLVPFISIVSILNNRKFQYLWNVIFNLFILQNIGALIDEFNALKLGTQAKFETQKDVNFNEVSNFLHF